MKRIFWGFIIIGIILSIASIFLAESQPLLVVGFFGLYLLAMWATFTYLFDNIKVKRELPELLPELLNQKNIIAK
ncbi:hypothetical protein DSAG12_00486 [Promethearchaeum syntrophicum]|uniref:Uncharacterized protein n=1 Tax=Promethearchaeum syntrophicum TaxID=2594042 RepID=A0A5B9D6S8_9ARCH|nr:hypothetical protein [Candidatus Prometheoarchaeum syntrophicum]QEE14673.1 hypothetical protein DSAG12_00486 [Candidatus Prometheoarchaeum syntrophicum]